MVGWVWCEIRKQSNLFNNNNKKKKNEKNVKRESVDVKGKKRKEVTYNLMKAVLPASKTSASKLALLSETAWPAATATSVERTIVLSIFFLLYFFCGDAWQENI